MLTLEISKSKYINWIKEQLEEIETLDDFNYKFGHIPDFVVINGFNEVQEFLMEVNKDNPAYFTFFIKEMIHIDGYGIDQIDIEWVD